MYDDTHTHTSFEIPSNVWGVSFKKPGFMNPMAVLLEKSGIRYDFLGISVLEDYWTKCHHHQSQRCDLNVCMKLNGNDIIAADTPRSEAMRKITLPFLRQHFQIFLSGGSEWVWVRWPCDISPRNKKWLSASLCERRSPPHPQIISYLFSQCGHDFLSLTDAVDISQMSFNEIYKCFIIIYLFIYIFFIKVYLIHSWNPSVLRVRLLFWGEIIISIFISY